MMGGYGTRLEVGGLLVGLIKFAAVVALYVGILALLIRVFWL